MLLQIPSAILSPICYDEAIIKNTKKMHREKERKGKREKMNEREPSPKEQSE